MWRFSIARSSIWGVAAILLFSPIRGAYTQDSEPTLLTYEEPDYPPLAVMAKVEGSVDIEFRLNDAGVPVDVSTVNGHPLLRGYAMRNVETWRFAVPAEGHHLARRFRTRFEFSISEALRGGDYHSNKRVVEFDSFRTVRLTAAAPSNLFAGGCPEREAAPPAGPVNGYDFVELNRSRCYGTCPDYRVRLYGNGRIEWSGMAYVAETGEKHSYIDPVKAQELLEAFRTIDFWSLCGSYYPSVTDSSASAISLYLGGETKSVSDYARSSPLLFRELMDKVDAAANTHRWRHGDPRTEPLSGIDQDAYLAKPGVTPLMRAARSGDSAKLKALLGAGVDLTAQDESGWDALMYAAASYKSEPVQILLAAGANASRNSINGDTALMASALRGYFDFELAAAGMNLNAQNQQGETALMLLAARSNPDEIEAALKAGANPNLKDARGLTALDYLLSANCYVNPIRGEMEMFEVTGAPCTAHDPDDFRRSKRILESAMRVR